MSETRPTPLELLSKTATRLQTRGPAEVIATIRNRLWRGLASQGEIALLVRDAVDTASDRPGLTFRRATVNDAGAYTRDVGTDSARTFRRRLTDRTDCYLVLQGESIVHASWATTRSAWTTELNAYLCPPPGDAYVYESFTDAQTRGQGIYPFALHHMCADLGRRGITRVWVGVEHDNVSSQRAIAKGGFHEAFQLPFRRRLFRVSLLPATGPRAAQAAAFVTKAPPR
ncbi:MAG TPA: hypothetical protein VJ927_08910 [Actinomycetota bacterium]|nr:hypothetical protein [Actinomycetota bacterium]